MKAGVGTLVQTTEVDLWTYLAWMEMNGEVHQDRLVQLRAIATSFKYNELHMQGQLNQKIDPLNSRHPNYRRRPNLKHYESAQRHRTNSFGVTNSSRVDLEELPAAATCIVNTSATPIQGGECEMSHSLVVTHDHLSRLQITFTFHLIRSSIMYKAFT